MTAFQWLASFALAATLVPALPAESHCPGNVASLHFHLVHRSQIIVPVMVNHTGPYDFLVDTGAKITMVDSSLAAELHLQVQGTAIVSGVGFHTIEPLAQLDSLEVGSQSLANNLVLVQDLKHLEAAELYVRGVLGGSFMEHFEVLIDNVHTILCLDNARAMLPEVKGQRIALVAPPETAGKDRLTRALLLPVHLSAIGTQQLLLWLDSGTNVSYLYDLHGYSDPKMFERLPVRGRTANGGDRTFAVLPPQDMKVGPLVCHHISFITLADAKSEGTKAEFDGLLSTGLFRRVYISYADQFVVLEPW
jgi:Aspartyl protease